MSLPAGVRIFVCSRRERVGENKERPLAVGKSYNKFFRLAAKHVGLNLEVE